MATQTTTPPTETPAAPAPRLWQLPFFLAGLGAFLFVYLQRPTLYRDSEGRLLERDLVAIRHYLTRSAAEATTALNLAEHANERAGSAPHRAGEIAFLLGSAHARKAELTSDPLRPETGEPLKAREFWLQARRHLENAAQLGVPEGDRPRLQYRLGKACFALGEDPERVVQLLAGVLEKADSPVEGHQFLLQAYLRLPKPDLNSALAINGRMRQIQLISPEDLAEAQLQAGEILMQLGQPEEAREHLKLIATSSSVTVLTKSRYLTARSLQNEGRFKDAINEWTKILTESREPVAKLGRVHFDLGYCYRRHELPREALASWEKCVKLGTGPEHRAAAVLLAELQVQMPDGSLDRALEVLELSLVGVPSAAEWNNELVEINRLLDTCERAIQSSSGTRREMAVRWTRLYEKFGGVGRALQLRADLLAQTGREQLGSLTGREPSEQETIREQAKANLREAAQAYGNAATQQKDPGNKADLLWKAANVLIAAQDLEPAVADLSRLIRLLDDKDATIDQKLQRRGQAWYTMGEVLRQLNSPKADEAYQNCINTLGPYAARARYHLAQSALRRGELDDAEQILRNNLQSIRFDPDAEAEERTLFALGGLYYQQAKYQEVARTLEVALGRFPANPEATRAHLQLAQSYRQLSNQQNLAALTNIYRTEEARAHNKREHRRWLLKAANEFTELARFLETPESAGHLTPEERITIPFSAGECRFDLGEYGEAVAIYNYLAEKHKALSTDPKATEADRQRNLLDALNALGGSVRCHAQLGQLEPFRQKLAEVRTQAATLDEAQRAPWEDWLREASKPLQQSNGPAPAPAPMPVEPSALTPGQLKPNDLQPMPQLLPALGPERIVPLP